MDDQYILKEMLKIVEDHEVSLTEEDIFNFLKIKRRWPSEYPWKQRSVEVIGQWHQNVGSGFFDYEGLFIYDMWRKYYDAGFTTILSNILDLNSQLRDLAEKLFYYTGTEINGNFYFSLGSSNHRVSFPPHQHEYHVIVKPIYGTCKWRLVHAPHGNTVELDNTTESFIIPAGTSHSVYECLDKKLSLTLNIS